jgi:hypothetical protein
MATDVEDKLNRSREHVEELTSNRSNMRKDFDKEALDLLSWRGPSLV